MGRVPAISSEIQDLSPALVHHSDFPMSLGRADFQSLRHLTPYGRFPSLGRDSSRPPQGQLEFGAELAGPFSHSGVEVSEDESPNLVIGECLI